MTAYYENANGGLQEGSELSEEGARKAGLTKLTETEYNAKNQALNDAEAKEFQLLVEKRKETKTNNGVANRE